MPNNVLSNFRGLLSPSFLNTSMWLRSMIATRKKYIYFATGLTVASIASLLLFSSYYLIAFAAERDRCLPYRLFFVEKGLTPVRGDYISFVGQDIPYFPEGKSWIKIATGVEGDRITVRIISREERELHPEYFVEKVYLNGMPINIGIQGYVYLHKKGETYPQTFRVLEKTTTGKPVPMIEPGLIPQGSYFVTTPIQRSFDSRYWGLVKKENVIGEAYPIY